MAEETAAEASSFMDKARALLERAMEFADLLVAFGIVSVVVMLVIPLPAFLLDILMSCNIALGLVVVISATYVEEALEFSVFPSLLLVTTLARLALNVSSTRLILLEGKEFDGEVIKAFGDFVVGGNYVVGIIIFAILVLIQFMVITKGSERVAEVAARFTLDAMPGKQMAIDADLNAGLIDETAARERREKIANESDFYGAMDGASKFVKGDTIAGIIITVINVVGGIIIGFFSGEFEGIAEIAQTYTLLTVGDGLVSIIPSLLISVATGIVVTKTTSKENLGAEVIAQLVSKPKALLIASSVFLLFALVPGLPKIPFFLLSTFLGFLAVTLGDGIDFGGIFKKEDEEGGDAPPDKGGGKGAGGAATPAAEGEEGEEEDAGPEDVSSLLQVDTLEMEIGYGLIPMVDPNQGGDLLNRVKMIRRQIAMELGLVVPAVRIRDNMQLPPNKYSIKLKGIEIGDGEIYVDRFLAMDPGMVKQRVDGLETVEPAFNLKALWIEEATREEAEYNGYTVVDAPSVVATHLTELIKRHSGEILGRQEARQLVEKIKETSPAVVEAAVPENDTQRLGHLQKVLQSLLKEGVSIRNLAGIMESFADIMSPEVTSIDAVVEYVRQGLARQITREYTTEENILKVITLEPGLEQQFVDTIQRTSTIHQALDPDSANELFQRVNAAVEELLVQGISPVLLCSPVIRVHFKRLVERVAPQLVVLSFQEIVTDVEIDNVQVISLGEEE